MKGMDLSIDTSLVSRLFLGALSEHEQRMLAVALLRNSSDYRAAVYSIIEPFEMFDSDLTIEYSEALARSSPDIKQDRKKLLERAALRIGDLGALMHDLTVVDALALGDVTRKIYSWSMAEFLLQRGCENESNRFHAKTDLYLALMVIDVVELLGAAGHSPSFPGVVPNVRQRIHQAIEVQES